MSNSSVLDQAKKLQPEIVDLRRHLHSEPELSFYEHKTAELAANKLDGLGYKVKRGVGKTGVTADIGTGTTVAIRADMDGLPIDEATQKAYSSKNKGVMHACGHDAHVSCALAAAKILSGEKQELNGRIRMLMQPAEEFGDQEGKSGAYRMLEDDALAGVVPNEIAYDFHVLLLTHGRQMCKAPKPLCSKCPLQTMCSYNIEFISK